MVLSSFGTSCTRRNWFGHIGNGSSTAAYRVCNISAVSICPLRSSRNLKNAFIAFSFHFCVNPTCCSIRPTFGFIFVPQVNSFSLSFFASLLSYIRLLIFEVIQCTVARPAWHLTWWSVVFSHYIHKQELSVFSRTTCRDDANPKQSGACLPSPFIHLSWYCDKRLDQAIASLCR